MNRRAYYEWYMNENKGRGVQGIANMKELLTCVFKRAQNLMQS